MRHRLFPISALVLVGLFVVLSGLAPAQSPSESASDGLHEVVVTGRGTTDEEALRAAFVTALERTVGAIVHSSTVSRNFQIESDVQRLLTNGCIDSYDEISSSESNGVVSKTIRARVRRGLVADWMRRSGWSGQANLNDTWARLATTIRSRKQALEMLHDKVPAIRDALYSTVLVDLSTGREVDGGSVPPPFTEENLDGEVLCVWAATFRPDFEFWENHAAPLLAACFEALCEKKARLFLNMETGPAGLPASGGFARIATRRWQRFTPGVPPPWADARPVSAPPHAPHCIALETRTTHAESLDLSLYFFTPEVFQRILSPRPIHDAEGKLVAAPERFGVIRCGLRARLEFSDGSAKTFAVVQPSPLFQMLPLPWPGGVQAAYCGPFLFPALHSDGWQDKSAWPAWQGPVRPARGTPGFAPFLIEGGRVQRADGEAARHLREIIDSRRGHLYELPPTWETDDEVIVPLVFDLQLDELRRIRRLAVEPVTGAPPLEPGVGESLKKFLKRLFD
ncbi:MAG: hypothetical protein ACKOAS_10645 [Verrucomicrobiota bacterium]